MSEKQAKILRIFGFILGALALILICITPIYAKRQEKPTTVHTLIDILDTALQKEHELPFFSSHKYGYCGNLLIPDLDVKVGLNPCKYYNDVEKAAEIVDGWNSAVITYNFSSILIGDHRSQAFKPLDKVEVGQDAYICLPDRTYHLTCVAHGKGFNTGKVIELEGKSWYEAFPGCIVLYTCNGSVYNILYSVWK